METVTNFQLQVKLVDMTDIKKPKMSYNEMLPLFIITNPFIYM